MAGFPESGGQILADRIWGNVPFIFEISFYKSTPKIANDFYNTGSGFYGLFNVNITELALRISGTGSAQDKTRIKDFISYDTGSMSISVNIPTKFLPFGQQETKPDFATIESTDNLIVYVTGTT